MDDRNNQTDDIDKNVIAKLMGKKMSDERECGD